MPSPIKSLKSIEAGELVVLPWPKDIEKLTLNKQDMSVVSVKNKSQAKDKKALGVIDINGDPTAYIVGRFSQSYGHAFLNPTEKIFIASIPVRYPDAENRVQIRLPSSFLKQISEESGKVKVERALMRSVITESHGDVNFSCWDKPLHSKIVSTFGSPRHSGDGQNYYHAGLDFRAGIGTPIHPSASGRVAFADKMITPGNVVVVDHGGGFYSRYLHLSQILVKAGETVSPKKLIGLSGATGRVEAPHLHWEVVWKGNHADPQHFLRAWAQICDPG